MALGENLVGAPRKTASSSCLPLAAAAGPHPPSGTQIGAQAAGGCSGPCKSAASLAASIA